MKILSIGTGREWRTFNDEHPNDFVVHVDFLYNNVTEDTVKGNCQLVGEDVFTFLENYPERDFDKIEACRVFEHIPMDRISYLLYLLYSVSNEKATLRIIVPDFLAVAKELSGLEENLACNSIQLAPRVFNRKMIELTTEFFNEKHDPHQSIWTPQLAVYYLSLEGYWLPVKLEDEHVQLDGRDWYLDVFASRAAYIEAKKLVVSNGSRKKG